MNSFHRIGLVAVLAVGLLLNLVLLSPLVQVTAETTEGDFVYVALPYANAVGVVDMEAQSLVETISFDNDTCHFPWQLALDPLGEQLYVACKDGDSVVVVETATNTVVSEIEGVEDASGIAFTRDGAWALVGSRDQNQIVVVDTAVMTVTETIYTPGYTRNLVPHPYLDQIFATSGNGQILIIDTNQMDIVQAIDTSGTDPWDVAVSADGLWLFTGDRWGAGLDVIDLASGLIHDTVTGVGSVTSLAVNPNGQEVYALSSNQEVRVVDVDSLSLSGTINGFNTSWGLAMACGGEQLYVSQTSGAVSAIDLGLKTVDVAVYLNGTTTRGLTACPEPVISGLIMAPAAQAMSAARGEQVDYELRLTNATNVTDTFTLVSGGAEWATSLSVLTDTVGPLAHGESVTLTVAVTVPLDAAWYLTDTAVITATSVSSPTVTTVAQVTTEAYAPPAMSLNPQQVTATVEVDSTLTQTLVISNGNGVPLAYEIQVFGEGGTSFAAASKTQYGYGIPNTALSVYGLEDNTAVTITDLETGEVLLEKPDLNRLETLDAYPNTVSNRPFKVESSQPVLSRQNISEYFKEAMAFLPSESGTPSGNKFVFLHYLDISDYYVFAPTGARVTIKDGNDNVVTERTMSAGSYWPVQLPNAAMYQLEADRPVLLQSISQKGFTTVPDVGGAGSGTAFYFAASDANGALAVFAYETTDVAVYSLDTDELLWSETIEAGDYWWQPAIPAGPFYLTSTAVVEVWAGGTLDSVNTNIEHLGDDISFAGGRDDRDYYVHSLGGGSVIFAPYAGTFLDIDGEAHYLQKDGFMLLEGCCAYRHIRASQPIVIQTLGKASTMSYWTNIGAYLGGTTEYGDDTLTWLSVAPITGTVATNSHETAVLHFNAYQLQPGDYRAQLQVINNEPPSFRTAVPVTMTVVPAANMGLVMGSVSDYRSDEPLEAVITAVGQPYTITTNADGTYEFWLEEGTHTLTVQAPGYETTTREVAVVAQQTTTEDFALIQSVSFLILEPDTLAASQAVNQQTTQAITLTNDGPIPFTYELREIAGTFTPTMGLTPFASPNDGGPDEFGYIYRDSDDADGPYYRWIDISETGTELVTWDVWEDTVLGPVPLGFAFPYYGEQYEQFYVTSNGYVSFGQAIDPVYNPLPDVNNPNNMIVLFGRRIYGLFDQQGESDTRIYYQMLSNPERAVVQFENPRDRYGQNLLGGAAQMVLYPNGNILMQYELESASNRVVGIENATGQIGLNYPHGVKGDLAICFVYPGNAANCDVGDVPWLSTEPVSGTVSAFSAETVGVTLDATGLQPGLYTAVVQVANDAHNGQLASIPVTMEVLPTGTMGHVTGSLYDLWSGDPVAGDVWVDGWYTDTAVYTYTFWADAGTHQLTVSAPGHMTQTTDITVVAGTTITQDIELEPAQARLENLPDTLTMTLPTGISATQTFTLANTGPLSLQYAWHEIDPIDPILPSKPTDATNPINGLRILYDASNGQKNFDIYSIIRAMLEAQGAIITVSYQTLTADLLAEHDVFWSTEGYSNMSINEYLAVQEWLTQGGRLLLTGEESGHTTDMLDMLGFEYFWGTYYPSLTDIRPHAVTDNVTEIAHFRGWSVLTTTLTTPVPIIYNLDNIPTAFVSNDPTSDTKYVLVSADVFTDPIIISADNQQFAQNVFEWLATPVYRDTPWLEMSPAEGSVAERGSQPMAMTVNTAELNAGTYTTLLALEHNDPALRSPSLLTVTIEIYGEAVTVSPVTPLQASGAPSETVTYEVVVTNAGEAPDRFNLQTSGLWDASAQVAQTPLLDSGESFTFTVSVTIPPTATDGQNDETTLVVTSNKNSAVTADLMMTTTAVVEVIQPTSFQSYLPLVTAK